MHSGEGLFFLSSEWEGGKISWQEKVRTYFSRYHLSCTRIFSCCQGVVDIWQTLLFKLCVFCPNGLPQPILKRSNIFALKWAKSVALWGGRSHNPLPQQQRNYYPGGNNRSVVCWNQRLHRDKHHWQSVQCGVQSVRIKALLTFICPVMWGSSYTTETVMSLFSSSCLSPLQLQLW